jgi:fructose-bisphosphate aldolase class II
VENLNYYFEEARKNGQAIGHFNFATQDVLKTIAVASKESGAKAVMVGTSEKEASFIGLKEAVAMVATLRIDIGFPIYLNADHFKSFEKCQQAIEAGYDSVIADFSNLSLDENIENTKRVVDYARSVNMGITVEGELGYLRGKSEVQDRVEITFDDYTKSGEAKKFVDETGVDRLAVVFGNIHGIVTEQKEKLDIEHFKKIMAAVPDVFYVLHGASGLTDDDIKLAIKAGVTNIHFNTELRVAYKKAIDQAFHDKPEESAPYNYLTSADKEVAKVVAAKTKVFLGL